MFLEAASAHQHFSRENLQFDCAEAGHRVGEEAALTNQRLKRIARPVGSPKRDLFEPAAGPPFQPSDGGTPMGLNIAHKFERFLGFLAGVGKCDNCTRRKPTIRLQHPPQHVGARPATAEADAGRAVDLEWVASHTL